MENNKDYRIVRANEENIADLSRLFKESRGIEVSVDYLRRKYNTHYTGKLYFAHFAYASDGSPAAFFCLFPCFIRINGEKKLAGQSADIITHKDHQRKGLFAMLGRATEELAKREGMDYLFAFPNSNSFPGFSKSLNWHHTGNFRLYRVPSNGFPLYRFLHKLKLGFLYSIWKRIILRFHQTKETSFIGADFETLKNVCWRDNSFTSYKKYNNSFVCQLNGFKIWAKIDGCLIIGDISMIENNSNSFVSEISKLCRKLGLDNFQIEVTFEGYFDQILKNMYAPIEGVPIVFKNLKKTDEKLSLIYTGADADVF
jgi:GNAT superfamily N-acetyltransferase